MLAQSQDALKTKTIHSEVLWALEPGTNVSSRCTYSGAIFLGSILIPLPSIQPDLRLVEALWNGSNKYITGPRTCGASKHEGRSFDNARANERTRRCKSCLAQHSRKITGSGNEFQELAQGQSLGCGSLDPWSEDCELTSGCLQIYKLNGDAVLKDVEPGSARESAIVNELCVSSVALKLAA